MMCMNSINRYNVHCARCLMVHDFIQLCEGSHQQSFFWGGDRGKFPGELLQSVLQLQLLVGIKYMIPLTVGL
jgi:hypothetical protein